MRKLLSVKITDLYNLQKKNCPRFSGDESRQSRDTLVLDTSEEAKQSAQICSKTGIKFSKSSNLNRGAGKCRVLLVFSIQVNIDEYIEMCFWLIYKLRRVDESGSERSKNILTIIQTQTSDSETADELSCHPWIHTMVTRQSSQSIHHIFKCVEVNSLWNQLNFKSHYKKHNSLRCYLFV